MEPRWPASGLEWGSRRRRAPWFSRPFMVSVGELARCELAGSTSVGRRGKPGSARARRCPPRGPGPCGTSVERERSSQENAGAATRPAGAEARGSAPAAATSAPPAARHPGGPGSGPRGPTSPTKIEQRSGLRRGCCWGHHSSCTLAQRATRLGSGRKRTACAGPGLPATKSSSIMAPVAGLRERAQPVAPRAPKRRGCRRRTRSRSAPSRA